MNKLLILLLVFTLSAITTVRTDANFLQTLLAGMASEGNRGMLIS